MDEDIGMAARRLEAESEVCSDLWEQQRMLWDSLWSQWEEWEESRVVKGRMHFLKPIG